MCAGRRARRTGHRTRAYALRSSPRAPAPRRTRRTRAIEAKRRRPRAIRPRAVTSWRRSRRSPDRCVR
jgi:hypothetical protein